MTADRDDDPRCLGRTADEAVALAHDAGTCVTRVVNLDAGGAVTADFRLDRVNLYVRDGVVAEAKFF
jgi:hypothetical protein